MSYQGQQRALLLAKIITAPFLAIGAIHDWWCSLRAKAKPYEPEK